MRIKVLFLVLVIFSLLASCNMPVTTAPTTQPPEVQEVSSDVDTIGTAVALTSAAQLTAIAGSVTPTFTVTPTLTFTPTSTVEPTSAIPTECNPAVTANVVANVRKGPGTAYDIVGSLNLGQSAAIVGRNDAYTWWYIDYPGTSGGHAWIAGSVVTSACVPSVVQVVAAPPLPTAEPTEVAASDSGSSSGSGGRDLVPVGMSVNPNPGTQGEPVQVMVGVKNQGDRRAGNFTVQWWSTHAKVGCSWDVPELQPGDSVNLTCSYTYQGWSTYTIKMVIDSSSEVNETNEGNNVMSREFKVKDN